MKTMTKKVKLALAVMAGILAFALSADAKPSAPRDEASPRLTRKGAAGHIDIRAGRKHFPKDAEVSIERARPDDVKRKIHEGWGRRHRKGASPRRTRLMAGSAPEASPKVLASYDIAIKSGGSKWQPDAGDPVRVTVELDAPVTVGSTSTLGVVHLADDGTVEELESSRYGFVYDATRTLVTAFWFDASGFSVYAITETETPKTDSTPARRLYDFYSLDFNTNSVTWNQYVRRYFTTMEGNTTFRQIVKDGQKLVRPEVLPSPLGRTFMGWHLYAPAKAGQTVDGVTYDAEGYATTKFDFTQPIVFNPGETGENEYVLRAVFDHVGYVIFHEQPSGDDWPITAVRRGVMEEVATNIVVEAGVEKTNITMQASVPIADVTVTYDDTTERQPGEENANTTPRMIFRGWSAEKVMPGATTNVLGGPIELLGTNYVFTRTKDTEATPRNLYPVFVNINWLAFSSGETGQGATYIPPHFFYADEGTNHFPVPLRTGYTFEGWYTSTNKADRVKVVGSDSNLVSSVTTDDISEWGGVISNGMLRLTKDTTLYANWTPSMTKYTVVVWQQKDTDAVDLPEAQRTYDFVDSYTNLAASASEVSVADKYKNWAGQASNTVHAASYEGFHFGHCDGTTTVNGNGSTVLNVYYDRNVHTLTFYNNNSAITIRYRYNNSDNYTTTVGDRVTTENYINTLNGDNAKSIDGYRVSYYETTSWSFMGGTKTTQHYCIEIDGTWYSISNYGSRVYDTARLTVTHPTAITSITALVGASIKDHFPIVGTDGTVYEGYHWALEKGGNLFFLTLDTMVERYSSVWGSFSGTNATIYYYTEVDEQEGYDTTFNGKYYKEYKVVKWGVSNGSRLTYDEEFHEITGYKRSPSNAEPAFYTDSGELYADVGAGNVNKLYYDRDNYTITFTDSYNNDSKGEVSIKYSQKITADMIPANPESSRPGYSFKGWYVDKACSTLLFFDEAEFNASTLTNKMLYARMPANNLNFYAGWSTVWYLIEIDPNGGELMFVGENSSANQSTWFWEPYNGDPIIEYTTVSRPFEESALYGTFFYAKQSRDYYGSSRGWTQEWTSEEDTIKSRRAYYTTNQSDPARVDDRRYRQAQNVYRYAGWYEVKTDEQGNETEELYAFGQPVQKNTKLKLHWKHLGTYRLHYDVGTTGGRLSTGDENETILETLDASVYADSSEILVTRTAIPPEGYAFAGWRIRYGGDTIYHPGEVFLFDAAYTRDVPGPDGKTIHQLVLDAVYTQVKTVALTTDANGGTLDGTVATTLLLAYPDAPSLNTNVNDSATQRTVSGMRNNAYGHLSDGKGYSCTVDGVALPFLGWNTAADGSGTHFDGGQYVGVDTLGTPDENGRNILYAEWGVLVYFDKNNSAAGWNDSAWPTNCVWDEEKGMFCQTNKLNGTATNPAVPLTSSNSEEMFRYWGIKRYSGEIEPYDFSTPITNASITLYGVWSNRIEVAVHAVDTTDGARTNKDADWLVKNHILMTADTYLSFETGSAGYAYPGEGYAFMCANLANSHTNVSEETMITNLYYNLAEQHVYVTYADGTSAPMPDDKEIYFVYFADPRELPIDYKVMEMDGRLSGVTTRGDPPPTAVVTAAGYDVPDNIKRPLYCANNQYSYFAYAIGDPDARDDSQIHFITRSSGSDDDRPPLLVRNTCHGFQYSTDDGATWHTYGFNTKLYVIYFKHRPTEVVFDEKTLGTAADMRQGFDYRVVVEQTTVTNLNPQSVERRRSDKTTWNDYDVDPPDVIISDTSTIMDTEVSLANGMQSPCVLFSDTSTKSTITLTGSEPVYDSSNRRWYYYRTNYNVYVQIHQTITVTQTPKANFTTSNNGVGGDQKYVYTYTTTGEDDETGQRVTFTNTHVAEPVEMHVALGHDGSVANRDDLRTGDAAIYTVTVTNGTDNAATFGNGMPDGFFTGDAGRYSFMGIFYARTNENGVVTAISTDPVTSVTFAPMGADGYFGLYFDGNPENAVGDWELYAVYAEMPRIYYVREGANGALSLVDPLTYQGVAVTNMGFGTTTVAQGLYATPNATNAFSVSSTPGPGTYFVPTFLDSLHAGNHLTQSSLAAGPIGATNKSAMYGVAEGSAIHLRVIGGILKWSADGATWGDFTGDPAVYVAYKEPGFDLTITKASLASDADKAADTFTFTISSANLTNDVTYAVSGYSTEEVTPENGVITLTMTNGSRVTIHALPDAPQAELNRDRQYEILEQTAADYTLTNTRVNGRTPSTPVANGVQTILYEDKTVEFTNIKSYTVTFVNEDGTVISSDKVPYGTTPDEFKSGVEDPTKPMDATSIYRFDEWGPTFERVGSNTTYTAEYKEIKIPQAVQRAADTNIVVTLDETKPQPTPEELKAREEALTNALAAAGIDINDPNYSEDNANDVLNAKDPNGLTRWENLVTGTDTNEPPLSTSVSTNETDVTVQMAEAPGTKVDLGYAMLRDLRKYDEETKKWNRVQGPKPAGNPAFNIPLVDGEGKSTGATGLYRVFTLLVPNTYQAITNEIPSTNIIGVLEVNSTLPNTIVAVPWKRLASDPAIATDITVSNHVSAVNLSAGDSVYALNDGDKYNQGTYEMWMLNQQGKWESATTVSTVHDANYSVVTAAPDADKKTFPRGNAVWVTRKNPTDASGAAKPFFLVGQYEPAGVTITVAGGAKNAPACTQVAIPDYTGSVYINELDWGGNPISTDLVTIPNGETTVILRWVNGKWGEYKQVWNEELGRKRNTFVPYTAPVPVGTGFWYSRRGGAFNVTWQPSEFVK